ncbi:hypothetical protein C8F04DRAFT_77527 [Mycena alexandri]|uniref:Uncharacterized protein n=1 Tax=Mycena alexandri TaxID=1745969 RepID=A0AAD6TEE9_9AGAR|nr:hypothetical protein C8F04DRAFT_77527 [Mycena alexandri]
MTADGRWGSPRENRVSSQGQLESAKPGPSRRVSRGFFSLFSSKGQQQPPPPTQSQRPRASLPPMNKRFDAISLTSPSQRDDPAFSRDPSVHHAHPVVAPRRDVIRTSAPGLSQDTPRSLLPLVIANPDPSVAHQPFIPPQEKQRANNGAVTRYEADYSTSSQASQSSLTLPSNGSSASSYSLLISAPSTLHSRLPTPTGMPPGPPVQEDPPFEVASPLAETLGDEDAGKRSMSPPPEYEILAPPPRPMPFRIDSAPELRHIELPGLPHRSATAPILDAPAPAARRQQTNDRLRAAYDLDRIDELDESNPLGVAMHHEGPFQAIASVLKGPSALGNQSVPQQARSTKPLKLGPNGGSLGIVPGQVLPRNFPYHQPAHPVFSNNSPQASTSYIPPQSQFVQPQYGQSNMRHPPPQQRPNHDPRWPPPPVQQPPYDLQAFPETQYDPVDEVPQTQQHFPQNGNPYYPDLNHPPPSHHVSYSSEDNSGAYGGIEEDLTPNRDRHSAPPVTSASRVQPGLYYPPRNGVDPNNGFQPRRHSVEAGFNPAPRDPRFTPPPDPRLNAGQNLSHSPGLNGQPVAGFMDSRVFQHRDHQLNAGQNLTGMRNSPNPQSIDPRLGQQSYPSPQVGGYSPNLPQQDSRRPSTLQPQLTHDMRGQVPQQHMAEHDPRRRASYQSVHRPPPGAAPVDIGRQQFDREKHIAGMMQDRPQSIAPSTVTASPRKGPQPQHIPKHLVMPTPLQQSVQLPSQSATQSYPIDHYPPPAKFNASQQAQPTRAQTIQMVHDRDGGRQVLKKRASVVVQPSPPMPPKPPPNVTRQRSYMEPPPTVPEPSNSRPGQPVHQDKKRSKKLLSKRRSDL